MGTMTVGRVGLDVTLNDPAEYRERRGLDVRETVIRGFLKSTSQANTDALRTELLNQQGHLVSVTYSVDSKIDGYYFLADVRLDTVPVSFRNNGLFPFELTLVRLGGEAAVELQSLVTGTVLQNDHGVTDAECTFWHAAPPDALAYNSGSATPILHTRTNDQGDDTLVFLDVSNDEDPTWSVPPGDFYDSAAYINTEDRLRTGLDVPGNPVADWELGNGHIRVRPQTFQSTSNGRINVAGWNGSNYTSVNFDFKIVRGSNVIPGWNYFSVLENRPEVCSVRLVRDADEGTPTAHRHTLDLTLRRGSLAVYCYYSYTGVALAYTVERNTTDAATTVTPGVASSAIGIRDSGGGQSWNIFSPEDHTADTTNGGLDFTSRTVVPFAIGISDEATTHDTANDLGLQYFGWLSEVVRAVRR